MLSKSEQVASLRKSRAILASAPESSGRKAPRSPAVKAKAGKPERKRAAPTASKPVRAGSKLEIIVKLLTREGGCTTKDILKATGWPAVSVPQQARAAGLKLRKEKRDGVTYYSAG